MRDQDLLFFGDSLIKHALIPSEVKAVSGEHAANLGAARCPTLMTYFLLRRHSTPVPGREPSSSMPSLPC